MDVSELRKQILRAIDDARKDAVSRRTVVDEAERDYREFLTVTAVPLFRQAATVLNAAGHPFVVHTPAGSARLAAEKSPETFLEIALDTSGPEPAVIGRVSLARGRQGQIVEERPVAPGTPIRALTDQHVSAFLVTEVPRLVLKP
jgi:hypothetical protein